MKKKINIFIITILLIVTLLYPANVFSQNRIMASLILDQINNGENIYYENVEVIGTLDLTKLKNAVWERFTSTFYINSKIKFVNVTFTEEIIGYYQDCCTLRRSQLVFNEEVVFKNCKFNEYVELSFARFNKGITFKNSTFSRMFLFEGTVSEGKAKFNDTIFLSYTSLIRAKFLDTVDFSNCKFRGTNDFENATFEKEATLDNAEFSIDSNFKNTKIKGTPFFNVLP